MSLKNLGKSVIHGIFKKPVFEKMLNRALFNTRIESRKVGLIPPNHSYPDPTPRSYSNGPFRMELNLFDYNDWKTYWGLKERERENLYAIAAVSKNIIDVGTNNGFVLMNMAKLSEKNGGFVFGFEPHPNTFRRCLNNIRLSGIGNCEVFNMGCSDHPGELEIISEIDSNSGQNRLSSAADAEGGVKVQVTTLDMTFEGREKTDLVKIDVEGFELNVLKGGEKMIMQWKPVLFIELDDSLLKKNNASAKELVDYVRGKFGYKVCFAEDNTVIPDTFDFSGCHFDIIAR